MSKRVEKRFDVCETSGEIVWEARSMSWLRDTYGRGLKLPELEIGHWHPVQFFFSRAVFVRVQ